MVLLWRHGGRWIKEAALQYALRFLNRFHFILCSTIREIMNTTNRLASLRSTFVSSKSVGFDSA